MGISLIDAQMLQQGLGSMAQAQRRDNERGLLQQVTGMMGQDEAVSMQQLMDIAKEAPDPMGFVNNLPALLQLQHQQVMRGAGGMIAKMLDDGNFSPEEFKAIDDKFKLGPENIFRLVKEVNAVLQRERAKYAIKEGPNGGYAYIPEQPGQGPAIPVQGLPEPQEEAPEQWGEIKQMGRSLLQQNKKSGKWQKISELPMADMSEADARERISQIQNAKAKLEQGTSVLQGYLQQFPQLAQGKNAQMIQGILSGQSITPATKQRLYDAWDQEEQYLRQKFLKPDVSPIDTNAPKGLFTDEDEFLLFK